MTTYSPEIETYTREMASYIPEIDTYSREMTTYSREIDAYGREIESYRSEMTLYAPENTDYSLEMPSSKESPYALAPSPLVNRDVVIRHRQDHRVNGRAVHRTHATLT